MVSMALINEVVLLAIAEKKNRIEASPRNLEKIKNFFETDPHFEIDRIEHQAKHVIIHFKWRPLEKGKK